AATDQGRPARSRSDGSRGSPARKKVAWRQPAWSRRRTTLSTSASSAITLIARGSEFGAWTRKRASAAERTRADSLTMRAEPSHRRWGDRGTRNQRVAGAFGERHLRRQHDGGGSHFLVHGIDAGRRDALVDESLDRSQEAMPRHDDAVVGRHQVLLGAIDDRAHALLQRRILHRDALDAAERPPRLLRLAIDQIVVVLVGERAIRAGNVLYVDALAVAHRRELGLGQIADRMIVEAPRPAVFVVDRDPEMAVDRMVAARRDHRERGHHPLRDPPVVVAVLRVAASADVEPAGAFGDFEKGASS